MHASGLSRRIISQVQWLQISVYGSISSGLHILQSLIILGFFICRMKSFGLSWRLRLAASLLWV